MSQDHENRDLDESTGRWMWAGLGLMVLFFAVFPIYRIYEPAQRAEAREELRGFLADQGATIYEAQCESCHGVAGKGALAPAIGSTNFLAQADDHQIAQLIAVGIPGTEMVAYSLDLGGPLTSEAIEAVTVYLRSLEEESLPNPIWRTPLADSDLSGSDLYALACARCHGIDQEGIEDLGPDLSRGSFALEETDAWLADKIRDGKDEMPRFGGVLTDHQINLILAFLRGVPPSAIGTTTTTVEGEPPGGDGVDPDVLALGMEVFNVTAGGEGCASCHGLDGAGTSNGPNIIGASKSNISGALGGGNREMEDIKLTAEELEAVYQYLRTLSGG